MIFDRQRLPATHKKKNYFDMPSPPAVCAPGQVPPPLGLAPLLLIPGYATGCDTSTTLRSRSVSCPLLSSFLHKMLGNCNHQGRLTPLPPPAQLIFMSAIPSSYLHLVLALSTLALASHDMVPFMFLLKQLRSKSSHNQRSYIYGKYNNTAAVTPCASQGPSQHGQQ